MRIGFDAKRAFLNSSGLGNYSRNTINALKEFYPENKLVLFSPKSNNKLLKNLDELEIVSPKETASKLYKSYWRSFKLGKILDEYNLNIFHGLSNELPTGIHKTKVCSLVTIHDLIFIRYPEFYKSIDRKIYIRKVKYACNSANKIIAISKQTKNDLIEFLKIQPDKIEVIHQSISPVFFEEQNAENLFTKYNLPKEFVLSVGTIERRKNQLQILEAVNSGGINLPIVFVGNKTSYFNEIQAFISVKKMDNDILFLNNIPEQDLAGLYQLALLSIYISVFEGFGLPVIESMACACPVITSNISCLPETAGGAAILCDPNDINELGNQIKKIIENDDFRINLISKGKERAKLFHPKKYVENLISLYSEILS